MSDKHMNSPKNPSEHEKKNPAEVRPAGDRPEGRPESQPNAEPAKEAPGKADPAVKA